MNAGVHTMPADTYHADPCDQPSLSASIADILVSRTPRHAWAAHPRLNPEFRRKEKKNFDLGTCAHMLLLEDGLHDDARLVIVEAKDWRSKAAQEQRDEAYANGRTPILAHEFEKLSALANSVVDQLADHEAAPRLFTAGSAEQTLVWEEDGIVCRARLDWLRDDHVTIDDLKSTALPADPAAYARRLYAQGGDVQAAFYLRGLRKLTGESAQFRWCVVETEPPFALSVITPGPDVLALGDAKVERALTLWRDCLASGRWPAYTPKVYVAELPAYEESRWLEREAREEVAA